MSWIKKRGQTTSGPGDVPPVQMYNPNQHSANENQYQHQPPSNWYNQPEPFQPKQEQQSHSENYWQQQQSFNHPTQSTPYSQNLQQYGQYQEQAGYYNTEYQQHQTYRNLQYNQQYNQNNTYPVTQTQQKVESDAWNWGWGDEDNSNVQTMPRQNITNQTESNVGEGFTNDESWNWSLEDVNLTPHNISQVKNELKPHEELFSKVSKVPKQNDPDANRPHVFDNLTVSGKRGKLETPQWSVESQMSQESSDDILHTSESDKSHMLSRSSTISHSPVSGHDSLSASNASNHNLEQVPVKNEQLHAFDECSSNRILFENKEIVPNLKQECDEVRPAKMNSSPPPPPQNTQTPPLLPIQGSTDDVMNSYKRTSGLTHKAANKFITSTATDSKQNWSQSTFHNQTVNLETLPDNSEQPDSVPNVVAEAGQQSVQKVGGAVVKPVQQWHENNEAPINDRNQYLETGQLSDANLDFNQKSDNKQDSNDTLPPPGLSRMVLGQMEHTENQVGLMVFGDEPPPGLSRMVLGQTESLPNSTISCLTVDRQYESIEPPEGLHRMVPGESSSPESTLRHQPVLRDENISEPEFDQLTAHAAQPRSATIGADTPPVSSVMVTQSAASSINRSETIGGDTPPILSSQDNRMGAIGVDNLNKKCKLDVKKHEHPSKRSDNNRRDSIEGQTHDTDVANLTTSVRNLTVGENLTDGQISNTSAPEQGNRRHSRQETSDSEHEIKKTPRSRDKRLLEKSKQRDMEGGRHKDRDYSPESYKEKKYERRKYRDRRYEDDTDYYSDKENGGVKRNRDDRDYDRKYNSLRKDKDKKRRDPRDHGRDSRRNEYYYRYEDAYDNENNRSRPSSRSDSMHELYRERTHDRDNRDRRHRERERERERDRYRKHRADNRDMYNPYQGFAYDPYNPYYQQYQYYKNLRRTNPQAYLEWYRKYYQQAAGQPPSYGGEDRASVHSGRSSANDELEKDRYTRQSYYSQASLPHLGDYYGDTHLSSMSGQYGLDNSSFARPFDQTDSSLNFEESNVTTQRLTPAKFSTAHVKAGIASGKLLKILPNYPIDGQSATVEICSLQSLLVHDDEYKELSDFPGPLVKGVTHKKTIIEYCENKIKNAVLNADIVDPESYVLMWELLILLIRQNGMVVGTDIAELLLKNKEPIARSSSALSSVSSNLTDANTASEFNNKNISEVNGSLNLIVKEEEVTNKFREYLLYGSGKEALEWAMKNGLWGHALFLASKLDKRTYANVMMRFANGLTLNDPLQTLYQLLSGKMPAAVNCVSDEKWGDWRPHLAMILSNSTQRPELNCKAITILGDTLLNRGSIYSAQFCYLMAEVGFGKHDNPESKLVLLGSNPTKPFPQFATNEAIHMTEIYEYACSLNDSEFIIPEFQVYKYLLSTRLVDRGLVEKSLLYLEKIAFYIVRNPTAVEQKLVDDVFKLADKLKFYDPVGDAEDESEFGGLLETSRPDNSWLKDLKAVLQDYQSGTVMHDNISNVRTAYEPTVVHNDPIAAEIYDSSNVDAWQQQQQQQPEPQFEQYQQNVPQWQSEQHIDYQQSVPQQTDYSASQYTDSQQQQRQYWNQDNQWGDQTNQYNQESIDQQQNYYGSITETEPKEVQKDPPEDAPQISMPNQPKGNSYLDEHLPHEAVKKESPVKPKPQQQNQEKPTSTGWFGGIFSKLALKPKNQMKLPDDKNPKIVWDQDKNRWINVDEDVTDNQSEFKPPPKMTEMVQQHSQLIQGPPAIATTSHSTTFKPDGILNNVPNQIDPGKVSEQQQHSASMRTMANASEDLSNPLQSSQPNKFKLPRGRNLKNSYVDVFNPLGKAQEPKLHLIGDTFASGSLPQMNFFIPQPVHDANAPTDFLTPAAPLQFNEQSQQL